MHLLALRLAWICNEWHDNRQANRHSRCYPKRLTCSWSCNNSVFSHRAACVLNESARHLRHAAKRMQPPVTKGLPLAFLSRSPIRIALFFLTCSSPSFASSPHPVSASKRRAARSRRTGNNLHMDTVHRYQSSARAVSVAELKHTHTHTCAERVRTTPWTRNSNSLLLVALRAPPAVSSEAISLWSPSLLSVPLPRLSSFSPFAHLLNPPPRLPASLPLLSALSSLSLSSLSLSSRLGVCCSVESLALCLSRLRLVELPLESGCERTWGVESWGSFRGVPAGPPWPSPPPPFTNTLTEKHTRSQAAAAVAFHW